jgi:squalene-hopene/tetraprenyl-beta-curcumene cyclase
MEAGQPNLWTGRVSRVLALAFALLLAMGAGSGAAEKDSLAELDAALKRAADYFVGTQSKDGAWRSKTYGCFRESIDLTPYVMSALFFMPGGGAEARKAFRKGTELLLSRVDAGGKVDASGVLFPVYTAASASRVVVLGNKDVRHRRAQKAWLDFLRERRLSGRLGWEPSDSAFGGWGFSLAVPRKPEEGLPRERFFESNLSATVFGIAALRSARVPKEDPVWGEILVFVRRCQNFAENPRQADPSFDDGGFFFIPEDPLQNKAGIAGCDRFGRRRFRSYGSMTADGLRALLRCGLPADHPRVRAARQWLEKRFTPKENPGVFARDREVLRNATYYYWSWAVAHAFLGLGLRTVRTREGTVDWARALADELVARQRPDGSWRNPLTDAKEDDPLVAGPWAAAALAICRAVLTCERATLARGTASRDAPQHSLRGR